MHNGQCQKIYMYKSGGTKILKIIRNTLLNNTSVVLTLLNQRQYQLSFSGGSGALEPPPPPHASVFKYSMKMKYFGLDETKLFHFHGIFKKNEIKSAKRTPTPLNIDV